MVGIRPKRLMSFYVRFGVQLLIIGLAIGICCGCGTPSAYASATGDSEGLSSLQSATLQRIIDEAEPGSVVVLPEGSYSGAIVIAKELTVQAADNVVLTNTTSSPAVMIKADGVVLQGLRITQEYADEETAAVLVQADDTALTELRIKTQGSGIMLRDANEAAIFNNEVTWYRARDTNGVSSNEARPRGNGIDLYNSRGSRIERNRIANMKDGIYLENSSQLIVEKNRIYSSRYGIHCMYIDESRIVGNIGEYNFTGAMIMGVKNAQISNNSFLKQNRNVYSQGLLLYDVQTSTIERNYVEGNRVGIYIERSSNNELMENSVYRNFIGIQMLGAENNKLHHNDFVANVIEAEATNSKDNELYHNYWDSAQGLDMDDDGISEIAYAINPFYQQMIADKPAFMLFFQSPGMAFLSAMYTANREQWTTDRSPFMHLNVALDETAALSSGDVVKERVLSKETFMLIIACMLLITASLTIIYSGVIKS
ncbi:right-handed parallel beta-helix repeat-containing protein [Paenibacillus aceti]|uniref:Copper ABC transporter substrate-binding protein n=1 Tax=Paenibacillus aceti TaxID=1820010 RepID=A0ABQ1W3X5_9BACL|nr:NosD domain-containing protein [Paenibacillus aceti]GGG12504.1 copper ABC transporter substrate-binding protein [Paenibacillus aceti]